jgi:hypothetical protein
MREITKDHGIVSNDTENRKKNPLLDASFLIFTGLALVAASLCFMKGPDVFCKGWEFSIDLFMDIMPRLIAAFIVAGFIEALAPRDLITKWSAIPARAAFVTAWSVFAFHRIVGWEVPLVGVRSATIRVLSSLVLPPLAGFQAALLEAGLGALT